MSVRNAVGVACAFAFFATAGVQAATIKVPATQPTIQAAVNVAGAGDTILVSAGTYKENVAIPGGLDGLSIKAKGKAIVDCRPAGAVGSGAGFNVASSNVTIQGFIIRHPKAMIENGVFTSGGADGLTLKQLVIEHANGAAIDVTANQVTIDGCIAVACDGGINVTGNQTLITKTTVRQDGNAGVVVTGADATVTKCLFVTIEDGDGIQITGANAVIEKNVFDGTDGDSIHVSGTNATIRNNKILRQCDDNSGIDLDNATSGLVEKNQIKNTYEEGILIGGGASGITVRNNVITLCASEDEPGMQIDGSSCTISKNVVRGASKDGINVTGDANTLTDNLCSDNYEDGIDLEVGADNNIVAGNKCLKNRAEGFENSGAGTTLTGNTMKLNRADLANDGTFATPPAGNSFTTGGVGTAPEIDD